MKHTSLLVFFLTVWICCAPGQVRAETLVFQGKSYCSARDEISWPFGKDPAKAVSQDKGFAMTVSLQPQKAAGEQSGTEMGSDMRYLRIISMNVKIGQAVTEGQPLVSFEMPLDRLIAEKQRLSRVNLDNLERALALVDYQLADQTLKQEEIEKGVSMDTNATGKARAAALGYESLLKRREALTASYEVAKERYDNDLFIARARFGQDLNPHHFPRKETLVASLTGHVLWVNSNCVPGMTFTKETRLLTIGRLDPILIRAAVHEIALQRLKVGDPVSITFYGLPGQTFQTTIGTINFVAQPATSQQPSFYQIDMTLPNPDVRIKEGMRCDVAVTLPDAPK